MKSNLAVPSYLALPDTLKSVNVSRPEPLVFLTAVLSINCGWNDTDRTTEKFKEKTLS
jgi:hypothetical protein